MADESAQAMGAGSLTDDDDVAGYAPLQIALHWMVVVLVAFQFFAHAAIEDMWRSHVQNEPLQGATPALANLHVAAGILVMVLALLRIALRVIRGAPPPPQDEPRLLQLTSELVHWAIYVFLLLLPMSGLAAWFLDVETAGLVHEFLTTLLLAAIALHIAGALFQHFVRRSQVMMRMLRPQRS
jgi:cytochrome b561